MFLILLATTTYASGEGFSNFRNLFLNDDFINEDFRFYGPSSDPQWREFWDVFNYRGPLQENAFFRPIARPVITPVERPIRRPFARPGTRHYILDNGYGEQYPGQDFYIPDRQVIRPGRQESTAEEDVDYSKYRDYFYRRYGTNFVDT